MPRNNIGTHRALFRPPSGRPARARSSRLWLWFVAAFLLQASAWTAWFAIAARNKVQEVPLASGRP